MIKDNILVSMSSIVFSSRDIQTVTERLMVFFSQHIPITAIGIFRYDVRKNTLSTLSWHSKTPERHVPESITLSEDIVCESYDAALCDSSHFAAARIFSKNGRTVYDKIHKIVYGENVTSIYLPLKRIFPCIFLSITSKNINIYTEEQLNFCKHICTPLSFAFSNAFYDIAVELSHKYMNAAKSDAKEHMEAEDIHIVTGHSQNMRDLMKAVDHIVEADCTVLLQGETGTGKELVANMIHHRSTRVAFPFIKIDCGSMPEALIECELFGCEPGAFPGTTHAHKGLFEQADGGMLFLDEVGDMPLKMQACLQRFLQFHEIRRIGGNDNIRLDLRIIASTRHDLRALAERGVFRRDIWFKLSVCPLTIPPLRDRREDIVALAETLIRRKCREMNMSRIPSLSRDSKAAVLAYGWPGNVRELENCIARSLIFNPAGRPLRLHIPQPDVGDNSAGAEMMKGSGRYPKDFMPLDTLIASHIRCVLQHTEGRVSGPKGAAEILGLNPNTLRSKMRKLNIVFDKNSRYSQPQD